MSVDYAALATTAATLIQQNGRTITVRRLKSQPDDPAKPWRGSSDPTSSPDESSSVKAVFVPPSSASSLGMSSVNDDLLASTADIMICEPGDFDFREAHQIQDGDVKKGITFVERLQPADVLLLYYIGVER